MKRLLITIMAALSLLWPSHSLFAIEYCIDFLEYGNPGGWENSLKTCEQTIDCNHYYSYLIDIWLKDVPEPLVSAGFYLEYDPWTMSILELNTYDGSNLPGPWNPGSVGVADPEGPGTYFFATANLDIGGAQPDAEGDIIIAQIEFECLGQGSFTISTVPDFDTVVAPSFTVYDPLIDPLALPLNGLHIDYDGDWLQDYMDNCYLRPNGPGRGSCTKGSRGNICLRHEDCGANGFCSMDQEDTDGDYLGDACDDDDDNDQVADAADNCPIIQNGPVRGTCYAWSGMTSACTSDNDCGGLEGSCSTDQEDLDSDIVGGICDNCPDEYNPDQEDLDRDKSGDICDPDDDGDGRCDPGESSSSCSGSDECPRDPDNDADNDSLCGDVDNCPKVSNPLQEDADGDGFGDVCDAENCFAVIDGDDNNLSIFDLSGNLLYEKAFAGIGTSYFVSASKTGWLVKGCPLSGCTSNNWIIWNLTPDLQIENAIAGLGPGPFYTGITSGHYIAGGVYTGIISLYGPDGSFISSTNVWEEEGGWPYDYIRLGEIAGLANGGFVVPPEGGFPEENGLYTPYLYFYDNDLNLINKVDITSERVHLFNLDGLSDGRFVATCANYGDTEQVDYLCYFSPAGELIEKLFVGNDIPDSRDFMSIFIAGLHDGGVMLSKYFGDNVWIYHSPAEEMDLGSYGINEISSIAGNVFALDVDSDGIPDERDNCPAMVNPGQADIDGDCVGDGCDIDPNDPNNPAALVDLDGDGKGDACDNCSDGYNPDQANGDSDVMGDMCDNCPADYNQDQEDSYPPLGNGIGDACDCEGNFNCSLDQDVDGSDAALFKGDFGRSTMVHPCVAGDTCNGDFNCDGDVDGTDASLFKSDFGRSAMQNPCPACVGGGEWCTY